jgi:hypothetical protein
LNKQGNPETLVSSHPGNTNAGKTGVHSPRMLAPRAAEIEAEIEDRPAAEIRREIIRHDLAGLWALLEAVDAAFAGRVINSRNHAKDLLAIRLRLSKTIRAAAQEYETLTKAPGIVAAVQLSITKEQGEEVLRELADQKAAADLSRDAGPENRG